MSSESLRPSVRNNFRFCQQVDIQSDTTLKVGEFSRPRSCTGLIICVLANTQCLFLSLLSMKTAKIVDGSRRTDAELWRSLLATLRRPIECRRPTLGSAFFLLFLVSFNSAFKEINETVYIKIVSAYRYKHLSVRRKENVVRLSVYIPLCSGNV